MIVKKGTKTTCMSVLVRAHEKLQQWLPVGRRTGSWQLERDAFHLPVCVLPIKPTIRAKAPQHLIREKLPSDSKDQPIQEPLT